uniref:Uncharacterized protein n=1 Tax=Octactis speculum TaxID=3111310 RepID=A0A7S2GMT2_9STRA|mmetsp:Transcript_5139/g.6320  ORF Transcript_5139/g.6320 Transcript_5139/m.6320 type:complete len:246 (+) Transcript_5139:1-738(+)
MGGGGGGQHSSSSPSARDGPLEAAAAGAAGDGGIVRSIKAILSNVQDLLYEIDHASRVATYCHARVIATHDDGTHDLSYDGLIEYNVPARLLRPHQGKFVAYKVGDEVEGPLGWGSTRELQLPVSMKTRHITHNMAAFNVVRPSEIQVLDRPMMRGIHPLAIKNFAAENEVKDAEEGGGGGGGEDQDDAVSSGIASLQQEKEEAEVEAAEMKGRAQAAEARAREAEIRNDELRALLQRGGLPGGM